MIPKDKIKIKQKHSLKILPEYFNAISKSAAVVCRRLLELYPCQCGGFEQTIQR